MQTILGAGGAIGKHLAKELTNYTEKVRLVSRNPKAINKNDDLVSANLVDVQDVYSAVKDAQVVYLTVGLEYKTKVWRDMWPVIMRNVIDACKKHKAKLVFFDNVYMYDSDYMHDMTEDTPVNPPSKKGKIRQMLVEMIEREVESGKLQALIARSADFYGPDNGNNSLLLELVPKNFLKHKKANWFASVDHPHSFTYTPDAAKATAILGNEEDVWGQTWHLPTMKNPPTGKEYIEMFAKEMNVQPRYQVASKFMLQMLGLFQPIMREFAEMLYQYDRDYIFRSDKFEKRFSDFKITPYGKGVKASIKSLKSEFG